MFHVTRFKEYTEEYKRVIMKIAGILPNRLENFFQKGRKVNYAKDEIILGPHTKPRGIYFIEQGFVKIYSISKRGDENIHIIYKPGEIFPIVWALRNRRHNIFYSTVSDCQLRLVARGDFLKFIKASGPAAYLLLIQLADQFSVHINRVESLGLRHVNERVAHRLLMLATRFGKKRGNKITIEAPLTHQTIADSINLTRESVSREIERLEKQNIIEYSEHKIVINNAKKLAEEFD